MTKFQVGTILACHIMDGQMHSIGKAIRPLFADPCSHIYVYCEIHFSSLMAVLRLGHKCIAWQEIQVMYLSFGKKNYCGDSTTVNYLLLTLNQKHANVSKAATHPALTTNASALTTNVSKALS